MADSQKDMTGRRVLVVEDEAAIAMLIEDMLLDLGVEIVGPVGRLAPAIAMAETETLDLAIVDVNLAGEPIYPLAEVLSRRGINFVFSTGYGSGSIEEPWKGRPVLQKPFTQDELERAVRSAAA